VLVVDCVISVLPCQCYPTLSILESDLCSSAKSNLCPLLYCHGAPNTLGSVGSRRCRASRKCGMWWSREKSRKEDAFHCDVSRVYIHVPKP
jgi:hypothetical protein